MHQKIPIILLFFRLSIAENYQYRCLKQFGVSQKQSFNLDFGISLSIDEYKDKVIVNIKEINDVKLTVSVVERNIMKEFTEDDQKGDLMLEEVKKYTLALKEITFAIQTTGTVIEGVTVVKQIKNYKDYYRMEIKNIQAYDYMGLQPQFIFHVKHKQKKRFTQSTKQKRPPFFEISAVVNSHKNALIFQKCQGALSESVYYLSGELILAYVKNYYQSCFVLNQVLKYYRSHRSESKESPLMTKKFIVESLKWAQTSLTINSRNLGIFQTFLNKRYQKLIVKFLNWVGALKPFNFDGITLNYEQITLRRMRRQVNLNRKMHTFVNLLMDYPLNQLKEIVMFVAGEQQKSFGDRLQTLYKLVKTVKYVLEWGLSLNENLQSHLPSYNQSFKIDNKDNNDVIDKMRHFQYCEWKYKVQYPTNWLNGKYKKLQRYNTRTDILSYDQKTARVKLAMDSFLKNKLFKPINKVYKINDGHLTSIMDQWLVLCFVKNNKWIVMKLQHFLSCRLSKGVLLFSYWRESDGSEVIQFKQKGHVKQLQFKNLYEGNFNEAAIQEFKQTIKENILSCTY